MQLTLYQADAFSAKVFGGNPAAICPLHAWLPDSLLQSIAEENNLAETAYFVSSPRPEADYELRWFTPVAEVDLCGHATLASAAVLFDLLDHPGEVVRFLTRSGVLAVTRAVGSVLATEAPRFEMSLPATIPAPCETPVELAEALGRPPRQTLSAHDYIAVYDTEDEIAAMEPDMFRLRQLPLRGVIITAPGRSTDFVSRFFAPALGIPEDPVTGSAYAELAPYWAQRPGRDTLTARQLSSRSGNLGCRVAGDRVFLTGAVAHYMRATITVPDPVPSEHVAGLTVLGHL